MVKTLTQANFPLYTINKEAMQKLNIYGISADIVQLINYHELFHYCRYEYEFRTDFKESDMPLAARVVTL